MSGAISLTRDEISKIVDGNARGIEFLEQLNDILSRYYDPPWQRRDNIGAIEMTRITSWVKSIRMTFSGLSVATPDDFLVQLGYTDPNTGLPVYYTTGYNSTCTMIDGSTVTTVNSTSGMLLRLGTVDNLNGAMDIYRMPTDEPDAARWLFKHIARTDSNILTISAGRRIVDQLVDRIRVISATGAVVDGGLVGFEVYP